jgi:hypothetical protein
MSKPQTQAGKALLDAVLDAAGTTGRWPELVVAIEVEAREGYVRVTPETLAEALFDALNRYPFPQYGTKRIAAAILAALERAP